jgi:hypothetical protein
LTVTRIAPIRAVAYCTTIHSARFGDQMPTRSPGTTPRSSSPLATLSTWEQSSSYVRRTSCSRETTASLEPKRRLVDVRVWPIVCSVSAGSAGPRSTARRGRGAAGMARVLPDDASPVGEAPVVVCRSGPACPPGSLGSVALRPGARRRSRSSAGRPASGRVRRGAPGAAR